MKDGEKIVRQYYGDDGWTYVIRKHNGEEYQISRNQMIKNIYMNKNDELGCRD